MKNNFKVAVMLNGHPKHLETTQHLFKHWNNLYDDVHFDFFVSIWDTIDNDYESFDRALDINDLDWVTKFELLKEEDCPYDLKSHQMGSHQPHYCYTLKKVNDLRNSHDEEYDAVLQTRCDIVLLGKTLNGIIYELRGRRNQNERINPQITERNIFSQSGSRIHSVLNNSGEWTQSLWTQDYYFFGHPKVMDIFAKMFDDMWMSDDYVGEKLMHCFQAEHLHNNGIYNMKLGLMGANLLIREPYRFGRFDEEEIQVGTQVIKKKANTNSSWNKKNPTPKQLTDLINDRGLDWIYDEKNEDKILSFFTNTLKK